MPLNHASKFSELTNSQYAAIGRVVVEWSNLEYLLSVLLSRLLRTPEYLGRTYAQGLAAMRLQTAITEAIDIHRHRYGAKLIPSETLDLIESVNNKVTALRSERNKISHFCWCRSHDDELFGTSFAGGVPSKNWERRNSRVFSLADLERLHVGAYELTEQLMHITSTIKAIDESES